MPKFRSGDTEANLTFAVGPSTSDVPFQEITFSGSVTCIFDIETGSNLQFVTRATSPEAAYINELETDVWLMGDLHARYRAWAVWQEWYKNGQNNVNTMAVTYKKLFSRRHIHGIDGLAFTDTDMGDIIWGLIEHTQALPGGDLGITKGATTATNIVVSRTYKQGENIGTLMDNEDESGVWWSIDENLVYTAGALVDRPFIGSPLHLGANVDEMQRASGSDFANAVYGDANSDLTVGVWAEAADVATDPRGRWELAQGWPTVELQSTVDERTAAFLHDAGITVAHWNLEMNPARWLTDSRIMPGDHAVLVVPRSLIAPIGEPTPTIAVMCTQVSANFNDAGGLSVTIVVQEQPTVELPS